VLNSHGPEINAVHVTLLDLCIGRFRLSKPANCPHNTDTGEYNQADDRGKKHENFGQCQSRVNECHADAVDFEAADRKCLVHNICGDNEII